MATTYTPNVKLGKPAVGDASWGAGVLNPDMDRLEALSPLAALNVTPYEMPSASLNVRVGAGIFRQAAGTIGTYLGIASYALPASQTTYLWLTDAGVLTTGAAWPTGGVNHVRLAAVTTGTAAITGIVDARLCFKSANTP